MSRWICVEDIGSMETRTDQELIDSAPSIDIVFCKYCVKHNTHRCHMAFDLIATEDDDFCSYGQKGDENVETD